MDELELPADRRTHDPARVDCCAPPGLHTASNQRTSDASTARALDAPTSQSGTPMALARQASLIPPTFMPEP